MLTPAYASPEQVMGEPVGTASDVYQIGLLTYELLTGVRVQAKASTTRPGELKSVIVEQIPLRPSEAAARADRPPLRPTRLRGDLDTIVMKAIRKEPARRYGSVEELAADLRRYLQRRPISARPDSLLYRSQRFVQRNRSAVAAVFAVLVLLVWGLVQERMLRGQAEQARELAERAAREAERAQTSSERERARAEEVLNFIEKTLARASPNELGIELKVVDLLDDAVERLRALADPGVQASLYASLARTQQALGRPRIAEALLREALEHSAVRLEATDPLQVSLRQSLLDLLLQLNEFAELEPLASALVADLASREGPLAAQTLRARAKLIEAVQLAGEPDRALAMLDALIAEVEPARGPGPELAALAHFRARMLLNMRRHDEAIAAFARERAVREAYVDDDPKPLLNAIGMPLLVALNSGQFAQALERVDDYERHVVGVLGADTPSLSNVDNMRLVAWWKLGQFEQALSVGRQALADAERRLGADHPTTLILRANYAQALGESGRHAEALALLSVVRASREAVLGADAPTTLLVMGFEAVQMAALGRHAEALAWVEQARSRMREEHLAELWASMPAQLDLAEARILRVAGALDRALERARAAYAVLAPQNGPSDTLGLDAARELARILELQSEHAELAAIHARFPLLAQTPAPLP